MKLIVPLLTILLSAACTAKPAKQQQENRETPKALEKPVEPEMSFSKRGPDDLFESLYQEIAGKNASLNALEKQLDQLSEEKIDSLRAFNEFNAQNEKYYTSASSHLSAVKDSALKQQLQLVLKNSITSFDIRITQHKELLKIIESKEVALSDKHVALKLYTTLKATETFQKEKSPETTSLNKVIEKYNAAIQQVTSLTKN